MNKRKLISLVIIQLVALFALFSIGAGEEQPSIVDAKLGFLTSFKNDSWTPLEVEIRNPQEEFSGEVVVRVPVESGSLNLLFSHPIAVPENCRRKFYFPVRFNISSFAGEPDKFKNIQFQVQLLKDATIVDQQTFLAHPLSSKDYTLLVVDSQPGYYGFLKGIRTGKEKQPWQRMFLREVRELPDRIQAYDGIEAIWLNNFKPFSLRPLQ